MAKQDVDTYHDDGPPHPADVAEQERRPVAMAPIIPQVASQSTGIEMSRAVAEVQAMVVVAQANHRNEDTAIDLMVRNCGRYTEHKQAFYSYNRGGKQVVGLNVGVMRELLRIWGNAASGVNELQRGPGWSEIQSWAWDLQQNYRQQITFRWNFIRERSEESGGNVALTGDRDIYELIANMGARREREMIRRVLPTWFVDRAEAEITKTLAGDPKKFPARFEQGIKNFKALGVSQEMLEERLGGPRESWGAADLTTLGVIYSSIKSRDTTLEQEFPGITPKGSAAASLAEAKQAGTSKGSAPDPAPGTGPGGGTAEGPTTGSPGPQPPAGRPMDKDKAEALATDQGRVHRGEVGRPVHGGETAAAGHPRRVRPPRPGQGPPRGRG